MRLTGAVRTRILMAGLAKALGSSGLGTVRRMTASLPFEEDWK